MNSRIVSTLIRLNQRFYSAYAQSFGNTRADSTGELDPAVELLGEHESLLDVGCGNGRLQRRYHALRPEGFYVGIDSSESLLDRARREEEKLSRSRMMHARFLRVDITSPHWGDDLRSRLDIQPVFSSVAMLAVLHHIPSFELRNRAVCEAAGLMDRDGILIISTWQFADNERMKRKIIDPRNAGIDPGDLDPGDHILSWKRDGLGFRYCRHIDIHELKSVASSCGLAVDRTFRAGGMERNLSLFGVLRPSTD